jgi:hypothetical protein
VAEDIGRTKHNFFLFHIIYTVYPKTKIKSTTHLCFEQFSLPSFSKG